VVIKITEEGEDLLKHLSAMGIVPEASIVVNEKMAFDGSINITVGGAKRMLSREVASVIWVKKT